MTSTVLILGGRGRFGLAAARAFHAAGWHVLAQMRPGASAPQDAPAGIEWLAMELDDAAAITEAAQGAVVVIQRSTPAPTRKPPGTPRCCPWPIQR